MIDFPLKFCDWEQYSAWRDGSLWLSLDQFERFWPDAGLTISNGQMVKSVIRESLRATFARNAENRARWAADPDAPDDLDYSEQAHAEACLRTIAETAGEEDAKRVVTWVAGPVLARRHKPDWHRTWSRLLYHLREADPILLKAEYGLPVDTARKIVEISAHYKSEDDEIMARIDAAEEEPLSEWDALAYADYQNEDPEVYPLTGVRLYLWGRCFDRAWAEILRCTRPEDLDGLIRWGRAYIRENWSTTREHEAILPAEARHPA